MGVNRVIVPAVLFLTALTLGLLAFTMPPTGVARPMMFLAAGLDAFIGLGILLFGVPNRSGR